MAATISPSRKDHGTTRWQRLLHRAPLVVSGFVVFVAAVGALPDTRFETVSTAHASTEAPSPVLTPAAHVVEPAGAESAEAAEADHPATARQVAAQTQTFRAFGVSWAGSGTDAAYRVRVAGQWTDWDHLPVEPAEGPDRSTGESTSTRTTSGLVWVDHADAYEVQAPTAARDIKVHLIREEQHQRVVPVEPTAGAAVVQAGPPIHTRAEWAARDPASNPDYASGIKIGIVHHTVGTNNYSSADVPAILRGIQAFHMDANGWNDIGYNFLVDRFGGIWEGRGGGIDKPVWGAHAEGFNNGSVGVAVMGDFTSAAPTAASINSVARVIGWKLSLYSVNPAGSTVVVSGGSPKYAAGVPVQLANISGHRDTGQTACPGAQLAAQLDSIRALALQFYPNIVGSVDAITRIPGGVRVAGWAIDRNTENPIDVHVYADSAGWASTANATRADVGSIYPEYGAKHGFNVDIPVPAGWRKICVYGINDVPTADNWGLGCRQVYLDAVPTGSFDVAERAPGGIFVGGWALDYDTASPIDVHVYTSGVGTSIGPAKEARSDVGLLYPFHGSNHGFAAIVPAPPGRHGVCAYAINVFEGGNQGLGCKDVVVTSDPIGSYDWATGGRGTVTVGGWVIDPDTASSASVVVFVDDTGYLQEAGGSRPDVGAIYARWGANHGFVVSAPASAGSRKVCVAAVNVSGPGVNQLLGCKSVTVT